MKKRMLVNIGVAWFLMLSQVSAIAGGLLFNVSATGTPANVSITLCLNGKGPLSCQNYNVSALTLSISTTIPNHVYSLTGIKVNTPGYVLANLGLDCTTDNNGYCLFSVSNTQTKTLSLVVNGPLSITPSSLPTAILNSAYSQTLTASGGVTPYSYTISAGSLPIGLSLDSATGVLSGTPTTANTYNFTVTATDSNYPSTESGSQSYSLVVSGALPISPSSLPAATVGTAYSQTVTASGGVAPYTYTITAGSLPTGLSLAASTGVISGTPTTASTYSFTVTATDSIANTGARAYSIVVSNAYPTLTSIIASTGASGGTNFTPGLGSVGSTTLTVYGLPLLSPGVCDTVSTSGYFNLPVTIVSSSSITIPPDIPNPCAAFCNTSVTAATYPGQSASCTNVILVS